MIILLRYARLLQNLKFSNSCACDPHTFRMSKLSWFCLCRSNDGYHSFQPRLQMIIQEQKGLVVVVWNVNFSLILLHHHIFQQGLQMIIQDQNWVLIVVVWNTTFSFILLHHQRSHHCLHWIKDPYVAQFVNIIIIATVLPIQGMHVNPSHHTQGALYNYRIEGNFVANYH